MPLCPVVIKLKIRSMINLFPEFKGIWLFNETTDGQIGCETFLVVGLKSLIILHSASLSCKTEGLRVSKIAKRMTARSDVVV